MATFFFAALRLNLKRLVTLGSISFNLDAAAKRI